MRVLVVTIVHHPMDARIRQRQIEALLIAGHEITYAAPFRDTSTTDSGQLRCVDLPRAAGRHRLRAIRRARRLLRAEAQSTDLILLHDPELLISARGIQNPPVVWDVHEDTAAAISMKAWIPRPLRWITAMAVRRLEAYVEGQRHLILAEVGYRPRFKHPHPVVPNSTPAPQSVAPPGVDRVVYVGHLTTARGVPEMIELARLLGPEGPRLHLIGAADQECSELLAEAAAAGILTWHGFLPNSQALAWLSGALAGVSLLHDEPNYRHSMPTKIIEYMARGVPVVSTPNPPARELIESARCGFVVPFGDASAAAAAVGKLISDPVLRGKLAANGRVAALEHYDWLQDGPEFVRLLESWAAPALDGR